MDLFFTMLGTTLSLYLEQLTVSHRRRLQMDLSVQPAGIPQQAMALS